MINIYVTIHTSIHQSITNALLQRGGAGMMWRKRGIARATERERGSRERKKWVAVILKGCEQVTTPSALQVPHRNSRTSASENAGVGINTCKYMPSHVWCHINPFFSLVINEWTNEWMMCPMWLHFSYTDNLGNMFTFIDLDHDSKSLFHFPGFDFH